MPIVELDRPDPRRRSAVASLLAPKSIAVIGASEDTAKYGGRLLANIVQSGFTGGVYPINPSRDRLLQLVSYPSLQALPDIAEVAVMAIPREKVLAAIDDCAAHGVKAAVVITAKFSDGDEVGREMEARLVEHAARGGVRLLGPNCLGLVSPANRLVLSPSTALLRTRLKAGAIAFVSQSGALMGTLLDRAACCGVNLSHAISVGNQADLELADFVEELIEDPATRVICLHIEGLRDPARLLTLAAKARAAGKPVLAVAAGRTSTGARAAFSHTASIASDRRVFEAVCREENITLMRGPMAMLQLAASLQRHPGAAVRKIAVVSPSGGEAALAADEAAASGLVLAEFSAATQSRLSAHYMPGQASNPIDFGGRRLDDTSNIAAVTMTTLAHEASVDAILVAMTTSPTLDRITADMADALSAEAAAAQHETPAVYLFETGDLADRARANLVERGHWFTNYMGEAIEVLSAWATRSAWARPAPPGPATAPAAAFAAGAHAHGEDEAKQLLARYGVPVNQALFVVDVDAGIEAADALAYPLVVKIVSPDISHKSDVGGVALNIRNADDLGQALRTMRDGVAELRPDARIEGFSIQRQVSGGLEVFIGARRDPQFGPVVTFGAGGVLVELLASTIVARAPVAPEYVAALLAEGPLGRLLGGYRGMRFDRAAVIAAIVAVGWLAHDLRDRSFEIDVNPLIVWEHGCCAVDARILID